VAEPDGNPRLDEQLAYWTLQFERLTGFAYLGTAVLALGVLVQRTQLAYPAFIVPDDGRDRFAALLNARCAYDGIEYSLIIAAIILPTLIVVQSKLEGPNDGAPTSENAKPGLNEGVASRGRASLWDVAKLIVAMLLPLLTGALSGLAGIVA
jgi:hypothetical protein